MTTATGSDHHQGLDSDGVPELEDGQPAKGWEMLQGIVEKRIGKGPGGDGAVSPIALRVDGKVCEFSCPHGHKPGCCRRPGSLWPAGPERRRHFLENAVNNYNSDLVWNGDGMPAQNGLAGAQHGVALPMPEPRPLLGTGGSSRDRALARETSAAVVRPIARSLLFPGAAEVAVQRATRLLVRPDPPIARLVTDLEQPVAPEPAGDLLRAPVLADQALHPGPVRGGELGIAARATPAPPGRTTRRAAGEGSRRGGYGCAELRGSRWSDAARAPERWRPPTGLVAGAGPGCIFPRGCSGDSSW